MALNQLLAAALAQHKVSHAYLLTGSSSAREQQAHALAQALLCEQGTACGQCASCHRFLAGNHADFQVLEPDGLSVKIAQTKKMQQYANLQSYEGGACVVLIKEAQTMQQGAANSLLKILEEPPQGVHFILTAPLADGMLTTIISRCTWVRLGDTADEQAEITDANQLFKQLELRVEQLLTLLAGQPNHLLKYSEELRQLTEKGLSNTQLLGLFLQQLLQQVHSQTLATYCPNPQETKPCKTMTFATAADSLKAELRIEDALSQLNANVNSLLVLDTLFLELKQFISKKQV